jgi:hypothetical protein
MVVRVVADEVAVTGGTTRQVREGFDPSALEEERGRDLVAGELVQEPPGVRTVVGTVRMLDVSATRGPSVTSRPR